jgi:thiamine pyrophosphate-dependent acetolactate synthase large subunit-like protein
MLLGQPAALMVLLAFHSHQLFNRKGRSLPNHFFANEGANTLDIARNVIDMRTPRTRLDSGRWGAMGIGMGDAIGAAADPKAGKAAISAISTRQAALLNLKRRG